MTEANDIMERMKGDFAHRFRFRQSLSFINRILFYRADAEKRKREAMAATNKMLGDELTSSEKKLKHTEKDLMEFRFHWLLFLLFAESFSCRHNMENSPSAVLQSELATLAMEKVDLQRKSEQAKSECKASRQKLLKGYQV